MQLLQLPALLTKFEEKNCISCEPVMLQNKQHETTAKNKQVDMLLASVCS
jgi:hypothetical protein